VIELHPAIQEYQLKTKDGGGKIRERQLRGLTGMEEGKQVEEFRRLLAES